MPAREIVHRWTGAMAAEGGRLLGMGIARRPCDIDRILVAGHGYPRWRGGPMFQADLRGLMVLRADLRRWGAEDPVWSPPPLFDRLLAEGRRLPDLDG
jgi:3-hydroxyacyl-CoA dehydrogenase